MKSGSLLIAALVVLFNVTAGAQEPPKEPAPQSHRYPRVNSELRSWHPDDPLGTYKLHSSAGCSRGGTSGFGTGSSSTLHFSVSVSCASTKPNRFEVDIDVQPSARDTIEPRKEHIDLTDLRPRSLELARDEKGHVYELALIPEVVEIAPPKIFDVARLRLHSWEFLNSPVILDDQWYVGQVGMAGGNLAGIDIAGVADCEFSLLPLKDAQPTGVLKEGILQLNGEKHSLVINGVRNGREGEVLKGPYIVWVRWSEPEISAEQAKPLIQSQIELLERRIADGDDTITPDDLRRLKDFVESGKPMLLGTSLRDARRDELAEPPAEPPK